MIVLTAEPAGAVHIGVNCSTGLRGRRGRSGLIGTDKPNVPGERQGNEHGSDANA